MGDEAAETETETETEAAPGLDPKTTKGRLLECTRCHEPVVAPAWSGVVRVRCGYCGFEAERDVTLARGTDAERPAGYRDPADANRSHDKISVAIGVLLPGHTVEEIDAARLRASCARRPLAPEGLPGVEWERVWLAIWLAWKRAIAGDPLHARIALETALAATTTPAYRALLLAHLAQHAAAIGAKGLAKKWLKACPDVAVAEVDSEIRAARAFIALGEGRLSDVLQLTGGRLAGTGYSGHAVFTAIALAIEANDRSGDRKWAEAILDDALAKKFLLNVASVMDAYGLGREAVQRWSAGHRTKSAVRTVLWSAATFAGAFGFWGLVRGAFDFDFGRLLASALLFAVVSGGIQWLTYKWASGTRPQRVGRWLLLLLPLVVAYPLGAWVHTSVPRPRPEPPRQGLPASLPNAEEN